MFVKTIIEYESVDIGSKKELLKFLDKEIVEFNNITNISINPCLVKIEWYEGVDEED